MTQAEEPERWERGIIEEKNMRNTQNLVNLGKFVVGG
jgi:hypothetical protein